MLTANILNEYFANIPHNLVSDLPTQTESASSLLNNVKIPNNSKSFFLNPISESEIINIIMKMTPSRSRDIYGVSPHCLKSVAHIISKPLEHIFNLCFSTGIYPDKFKVSKVVPVFKKGEHAQPQNYRPISLIPTLSKILEIAMSKRLMDFLEQNCYLSSKQFGFRSGLSTTDAVINLVTQILNGFECGAHTDATLFDLTKAFDTVDHDILLQKLMFYGIRGMPLLLFESYLKNRSQIVYYADDISTAQHMTYGVPQGSHLGPLLFLLYINDLPYYIPDHSNSCIYVDDTTVTVSDTNMNSLNLKKENTLHKTSVWFISNKLILNEQKTQNIFFSLRDVQGTDKNKEVKFLGLIMDPTLSWKCHINTLCKRLSSVIYMLRRLTTVTSPDIVKLTYYAMFHSIMSYGITVWGASSENARIFLLQKKALRTMAGTTSTSSCRPLFKKFNILTFHSVFILECLLMVKKIYQMLVIVIMYIRMRLEIVQIYAWQNTDYRNLRGGQCTLEQNSTITFLLV